MLKEMAVSFHRDLASMITELIGFDRWSYTYCNTHPHEPGHTGPNSDQARAMVALYTAQMESNAEHAQRVCYRHESIRLIMH